MSANVCMPTCPLCGKFLADGHNVRLVLICENIKANGLSFGSWASVSGTATRFDESHSMIRFKIGEHGA